MYTGGEMNFTWDEDKAKKVRLEHSIEFSKIIDIFEDPFAVEFIDEKHPSEDENRYAIIGLTIYGLVTWFLPNQSRMRFILSRRGWRKIGR
jgi:uncharacterized DUF497 family protein